MVKGKIIFTMLMLLSFVSLVKAEEVYFINENNVALNEQEYYFISDVFYDGFQNIITAKDYDAIFENKNIKNQKVEKNSIETYDVTRATYHETQSKKFTISTACDDDCLVSLVVQWKKNPNVRSYDVIGSYFDGVSKTTTPTTYASNTIGTNYSSEIISESDGFGISVKLPSGGDNMVITQFFRVTKGGTIYGSYQHATANISLANSKKYTIDYSGFGHVFLFQSSVRDYYDSMGGVFIAT